MLESCAGGRLPLPRIHSADDVPRRWTPLAALGCYARNVASRARALEFVGRWSTDRPALEAIGWLVSAVGVASFAGYVISETMRTGGIGYDLQSYLLAGRHALSGADLYAPVNIGDPGAYRYTPTFAYLAAPVALLPGLVVTWAYRAVCLLCVRYLVGSWRAVGWSLLFPPLAIELMALNLTLPIAALGRLALRSPKSGARWLGFAASLKYGSLLLMPYLWLRRPEARRALLLGTGALLLVSLVHFALDPSVWVRFVAALAQQAQSPNTAPFVGGQLLTLLPSTFGDFLLRLGIASVLLGLAIWRRWDWLAFTAATLGVPTLWLARLAPLVAVPRLWLEDRQARQVTLSVGADAPRPTSPAEARS